MRQEPELDLVVARRAAVADGVITLDLRDSSGAPLPAWAPGAHIDLMLGPGLIRQFSLCGAPADPGGWRIAVLREPAGRGGSAYVHDAVGAGSRVRVRGPRNRFPLQPADRYLFIAGGIGITPILPMLAAAARRRPPVDADLRWAHRRVHGVPRRPAGPVPRPGADPAPGRDRSARPGRHPRPAAARHAGVLLRARAVAGCGDGLLRRLAGGRAAPGALHPGGCDAPAARARPSRSNWPRPG